MTPFTRKTNSLRIRFAVGFSILFTVFLATSLVLIYVSFANFRKDEFYDRLRDKAITTFRLLVEVEQIDHDLLQVIDRNTLNSLYDEKVLIFKDSNLIYSSIDDTKIRFVPDLFQRAKERKEYRTNQGTDEVVALSISQNSDEYIILASAYDRYGRTNMRFLKWVMIGVYGIGLLIAWIVIFFFVKRNIQPLEQLKDKLRNINYDNLDIRLAEEGQGNEVDSLAATFNQLLTRLQNSFSFQKDFIHYASHELRTPLAAMIGITGNSIGKDISVQDFQYVLKELYQQQRNLTDITNSLLLLSDDKNILNGLEYPLIRLDELAFKSVDIIKNIYPDAQIEVNLEGEVSSEESLLINANEPLMLMAFNNLLKNALQYATDKKARVVLRISPEKKEIHFFNTGIPFSESETAKIFTPFYRASNSGGVKGYGLGLSLVKQIVQRHRASIGYTFKEGFNEFTIIFSNNSNNSVNKK